MNDIYGHTVGDAVIFQVGQLLKKTIRVSDMVCRWGGEEFIVVAPNTTLAQPGLDERLIWAG